MREILFKAKHTKDGNWVFGSYVTYTSLYDGNVEHRIIDKYGDVMIVDPETVCQYTGLTDSNDVKVFDGDILKFKDNFNDYEWIGRIQFGNPNAGYTWGWQLVHLSGEEPNIDTLCWFDMEESGAHSEVIGNIHDEEE